jgi:hypothetical protein
MQINKLLHQDKANSQTPFRTVEASFTPDKEVKNIRQQYQLNAYAVILNANDNLRTFDADFQINLTTFMDIFSGIIYQIGRRFWAPGRALSNIEKFLQEA